MSEPSINVDFLNFLKRSEPIGLLASLSLIVATFTYGHKEFFSIYNFSVTSSFMFLISFIFSLFYQGSIKSNLIERYNKNAFFSLIFQFHLFLKFGTYFFLGFGIVLMLLVMFEFGKLQPSIFVVFPYLGMLFFAYYFFVLWLKNLKLRSNKKKFDLVNYGSYVAIIALSMFAAARVGESLFNVAGISDFIFSIYLKILGPILFVVIIIHFSDKVFQTLKEHSSSKKSEIACVSDKSPRQKPIPKGQRRMNLFLIINIAAIIIFCSILIYAITADDFLNSVTRIKLNITSNQNASENTNLSNDTITKNDNRSLIAGNSPFSKYI